MSEDDIWGVMDEQDEEFADVSDDVFAEVEPETVKPVEVTATAGTEIKETPVTAPVVPEPVITLAPTPTAVIPPVEAVEKPKPQPRKKPSAHKPAQNQAKRPQLSPSEKAIRVILRRSGKDELPELEHLLRNKGGKQMRICYIGLFIGDTEDEVLADIAKECPIKNRVNLSAEVQIAQVKKVGAKIVEAGRMYQPIQVARIEEDGTYECTSGRHRLAFLALLYGPKASIKVYVEDMTLQEARDAVVVANMARPTKALERAEHCVLQAVHGDAGAAQDELYANTAKSKRTAQKYCVFSVLKNEYPATLDFKVSLTASREGGAALTTITNVENFWGAALNWTKEMERAEFDAQLKDSIEFLNAFAEAVQAREGFDAKQHMASQTVTAVGNYYSDLQNVTGKAIDQADEIAEVIVAMGDVARLKSQAIYLALAKALRK